MEWPNITALHVYFLRGKGSCEERVVFRGSPIPPAKEKSLRLGEPIGLTLGFYWFFDLMQQLAILRDFQEMIAGFESGYPGYSHTTLTARNASFWDVVHLGMRTRLAALLHLDEQQVHLHYLYVDD